MVSGSTGAVVSCYVAGKNTGLELVPGSSPPPSPIWGVTLGKSRSLSGLLGFIYRMGPSLTGSSHSAGAPHVAAATVAMLQRVLTYRDVSLRAWRRQPCGAAGRGGGEGVHRVMWDPARVPRLPPHELVPLSVQQGCAA